MNASSFLSSLTSATSSLVRIKLLYFAAVRDLMEGKTGEEIDLPPAVATIADLTSWLELTHSALSENLASVRFAQNEAFVTADSPLRNGDVIALIPPVAGG